MLVIAFCLAPVAAARLDSPTPWLDDYRFASHQPLLEVIPFSAKLSPAKSEVDLYVDPARGEIARILIFIPASYQVDLTQPAGKDVGDITSLDEYGSGWLGGIRAATPTEYVANPCAPGEHEAVWLLSVGGRVRVPLFVDRTSGADTALGGFRLAGCEGSTMAPAGCVNETFASAFRPEKVAVPRGR